MEKRLADRKLRAFYAVDSSGVLRLHLSTGNIMLCWQYITNMENTTSRFCKSHIKNTKN